MAFVKFFLCCALSINHLYFSPLVPITRGTKPPCFYNCLIYSQIQRHADAETLTNKM